MMLREKQYGKQFCSFDPITMSLVGGGAMKMGGTIFGGIFGANAERKRAHAIRQAGEQGVNDINAAIKGGVAEGNAKLDMARGDLSPFRDMGVEAGTTLADLLMGRRTPAGMLKASDLFNFQSDLGMRNINRELAARGMYGSGAGIEALDRFNAQLVGEEGQRLVDRLFNLTGLGANSAGNMASLTNQTGNTLANMIFNGGVESANMRYNSTVGAANARANANHMMADMGRSLFGQAGQGLMQYGNFMMNKPLIDQSMRMTEGFMSKNFGMTSPGDQALAQKHGISF
jgi:hypothetical protein